MSNTDISQYSSLVELHQGPLSTVWSGLDAKKGSRETTVVIKAYNKDAMLPRHVRNVIREKRILQVFNDSRCRGVVKLLRAFEDDAHVYLVFEPCMKGDLYQLMVKHDGQLQEGFVACHIVAPLLSTLQLLHKLGIVHRDVKTENCFMTASGELQLGDFGLAAHLRHDNLVDRVGTLDYMAPEVLSMRSPDSLPSTPRTAEQPQPPHQAYDEKVDVWAVGILVHELLVGRTPFEVDDPTETGAAIMGAPLQLAPLAHLPPDCVDFILAALNKSASKRPSAGELSRHPWLQRHMRGQAPNAGPRLQSFDIFEVSAMRQAIHDAWNLDELERTLSLMSLNEHWGGCSPTSSLHTEPSQEAHQQDLNSAPPQACPATAEASYKSGGAPPSPGCSPVLSGDLSPPADELMSPVGHEFRNLHSLSLLGTERLSWSAAGGTFTSPPGSAASQPGKGGASAGTPSPPPALTISAFAGSDHSPPSPTDCDGGDPMETGGDTSPTAYGRPSAPKPRLPATRSRFGAHDGTPSPQHPPAPVAQA